MIIPNPANNLFYKPDINKDYECIRSTISVPLKITIQSSQIIVFIE